MSHIQHRIARATGAALLAAAAVAGIASASVIGTAAPALAHDELVGRSVALDPATGALDGITLTFSDNIIEVGTEVVVRAADGSDATGGPAEIAGADVTQPLAADLAAGEYHGAWRVVSSDGHPIEGAFTLVIAEDGTTTLEDAAAQGSGTAESADTGEAGHGDSEHAHDEGSESSSEGAPIGAVIAVVVGGAAVIAGGMAAATAGRKRRARGMAADAQRGGDADAQASDEEDRA